MQILGVFNPGQHDTCPSSASNLPKLAALVSDEVLQQPRTLEVFEKIYGDPNLEFHLPAKKALPGAVLKHIYKFVEDLVAREYPLVYKLGFTHDAQWRFRNPKYGYCHDKFHKWEKNVHFVHGS